jgi:hypothetical protein
MDVELHAIYVIFNLAQTSLNLHVQVVSGPLLYL